jgi:hypothetical protein
VHPNLIAALAGDHRRSCPCGAVTGQPRRLCRYCLARQTWRRHITRHFRSAVRHLADRLARAWSWTPDAAASLFGIIAKAARS